MLKLGFNHPMGPFALSDLIGLDIVHDMAASMYAPEPPVMTNWSTLAG